jgi:hypothetical protein
MRIKIASVLFISGIFLFNPNKGFSSAIDSSTLLKMYEDSMKSLQFMRINARTDNEKITANKQLFDLMDKALLLPGSFDYPFDSLTTIGKITSPDKQIRIITWDVPKSGCTYAYYGFIQSYNPHKKKYDLFVLEDHTADIPTPQTIVCTPNKWIGMLYYKIIQEKGSKIYTLLAWQGYNKLTTRKVIDVLTFNTQGIPSFGKAIYLKLPATYKGSPKRIIFEYSSDVSMSLKYDEAKHMIVFDHLAPIQEGLESQHQYYGPSFQVDGLAWGGGTWSYVENVEARNPSDEKSDNAPKRGNDENKKVIYH